MEGRPGDGAIAAGFLRGADRTRPGAARSLLEGRLDDLQQLVQVVQLGQHAERTQASAIRTTSSSGEAVTMTVGTETPRA